MKLLALSGSPIKNGNTHEYLKQAVESVARPGWEIEIVQLAGKKVGDCIHCNRCLKNTDAERFCFLKDDGEEILGKLKAADLLVVASPAYFGRLSARLASLFDRTRPFLFAKPHRGCMTDKVGAALTVGWGRNSGSETTLLSIAWGFLVLEMIPVSHHASGALYGAAGISNPLLVGAEKNDKLAVTSDMLGMLAAQSLVQRALDLSERIKR